MKQQNPTTGVKGEIPTDLHRAIRKYMLDTGINWDVVVTESISMWAREQGIDPAAGPYCAPTPRATAAPAPENG